MSSPEFNFDEELAAIALEAKDLQRLARLAGEIVATLSIKRNESSIPSVLRPIIDNWRDRMGLGPAGWPIGKNGPHAFVLEECDRQLVVLGLAVLSIESPGFVEACRKAAESFSAETMFDEFRKHRGGGEDGSK